MGDLPSTIGPYRVVRPLGEGGMGAVYEAVHEVIRRRVAIKVLHPEAGRSKDSIKRFINEARAANLIDHPGLVQITDFGNLPDGAGYLVMEYLPGETLAGRLESRSGKLSPSDAVQVGIQIASALAATHKRGIIHRDLKPGNVMLVPDPAMPTGERVKVLDFGLAKLSEVREAEFVKTNSQAVLGTPLYMSPEQCEGAGRVDAKTDVYALGCMLYEMLAGQPPFLGEGPGQVIGKHLFKEPEPLQKLAAATPAPLAELVDRLLVKAKDARPSMRELQKALEALVETLPPPSRRAPADPSGAISASSFEGLGTAPTLDRSGFEALGTAPTIDHAAAQQPDRPPGRRRLGLLIAGALSCLALSLGGIFAFSNRAQKPAEPMQTAAKESPATGRPMPAAAAIPTPPQAAPAAPTPLPPALPPKETPAVIPLRKAGKLRPGKPARSGSRPAAVEPATPSPAPALAPAPTTLPEETAKKPKVPINHERPKVED